MDCRGSLCDGGVGRVVFNRSLKEISDMSVEKWNLLVGIAVALMTGTTLIFMLRDRFCKKMSKNRLEREIARICRKNGFYEDIGSRELRTITDSIYEQFEDCLPKGIWEEHYDYKLLAVRRFLKARGWVCGETEAGNSLYRLPEKLRKR